MLFRSTYNRGFQFVFDNDYVVSCQFGGSCYCEHYERHFDDDYEQNEEMKRKVNESKDCEVAIFSQHSRKTYITSKIISAIDMDPSEDMYQYNVTPSELTKILSFVEALKKGEI